MSKINNTYIIHLLNKFYSNHKNISLTYDRMERNSIGDTEIILKVIEQLLGIEFYISFSEDMFCYDFIEFKVMNEIFNRIEKLYKK